MTTARLPQAPTPAESPMVGPDRFFELIADGARTHRDKRLLLYVHVPFCRTKCHFCDWVVGYNTADLLDRHGLRDSYVEAVAKQISEYGPRLMALGYQPTNIYWGGGTPTRLSAEQLGYLADVMAASFDLSGVVEHTLEGSPDTVQRAQLETLMKRGLNRASFGVQSFDPATLKRMGRGHGADQAVGAIELLKSVGLTNFNIDLIAGFPDQTLSQVMDSLSQAIDLGVPHICLYMFRDTAEALVAVSQTKQGHRTQTADAQRFDDYLKMKQRLEDAGYIEYIIGYFAKGAQHRFDGEEHYFSFRADWIGFGAGANGIVGHYVTKSTPTTRYGESHVRRYIDDPLSIAATRATEHSDEWWLQHSMHCKSFATPTGLIYERWKDRFGMDFREFRKQRPAMERWLQQREEAGGRFIDTDAQLRLSDDTRLKAMLFRY